MATEDDHEYGWEVHHSIRILIEGESERKLNHLGQSSVSIPKVHDSLRSLNPTAYTPRIISIGPLHKEDQRLRAMEEHKVTYMYRLFSRTVECTKKDIEQTTHRCVKAVLGVVTRARACYAPSVAKYDDFKLAEMMVIDGCFILELLYRFEYGIGEGDAIFDNILMLHDLQYDLLLLENQIPLFVLEILFRLTVKRILKSTSLSGLILYFFRHMNILHNVELPTNDDDKVEHCHILGLLQSCYKPRSTKRGLIPTISYSATEIAGAGVTFKANLDQDCLLAVIFKQSSLARRLRSGFVRETIFKIPALCIKDSTLFFLRNLIAYEQCYPSSRPYVTSFVFLMGMLIHTKDDVSLLMKSRLLQQNIGACEDVTNIFKNLCNGVALGDFYYSDEWKQLDDYCNCFRPRMIISLRRLYKGTTWKTLRVNFTVILFVLTLIQTIYTVRNG